MAQRRINIRRAGLDETLSNLDIQVSISVQSPKFVRAKTFLSLRILGLDNLNFHPNPLSNLKFLWLKKSS